MLTEKAFRKFRDACKQADSKVRGVDFDLIGDKPYVLDKVTKMPMRGTTFAGRRGSALPGLGQSQGRGPKSRVSVGGHLVLKSTRRGQDMRHLAPPAPGFCEEADVEGPERVSPTASGPAR